MANPLKFLYIVSFRSQLIHQWMSETKSILYKKFLPQNCITVFLFKWRTYIGCMNHTMVDYFPQPHWQTTCSFDFTYQVCYLFLSDGQHWKWILKHSSYIWRLLVLFQPKVDPSSYHMHLQYFSRLTTSLERWPPRTLYFDVSRQDRQLSYQTFGAKQTDRLNYSFRKMYLIPLLKQTFPVNIHRKKEKMDWVFTRNCPVQFLHEYTLIVVTGYRYDEVERISRKN